MKFITSSPGFTALRENLENREKSVKLEKSGKT